MAEIQNGEIERMDAALKAAELEYGGNSVEVAQCLLDYAASLKSAKVRLLDAANMEARARVIHSGRSATVDDATPEPVADKPDTDTAGDDFAPCPSCAEPIRRAAVKCRFCGEQVGKIHPAGTTQSSKRHPIIASAIVLLVVGGFVYAALHGGSGSSAPDRSQVSADSAVTPGDYPPGSILELRIRDQMPFFADVSAASEYIAARKANDQKGIDEIENAGRLRWISGSELDFLVLEDDMRAVHRGVLTKVRNDYPDSTLKNVKGWLLTLTAMRQPGSMTWKDASSPKRTLTLRPATMSMSKTPAACIRKQTRLIRPPFMSTIQTTRRVKSATATPSMRPVLSPTPGIQIIAASLACRRVTGGPYPTRTMPMTRQVVPPLPVVACCRK